MQGNNSRAQENNTGLKAYYTASVFACCFVAHIRR